MNSIYYQNSKLSDGTVKDFIEPALTNFYKEVDLFLFQTKRKFEKYHLIQYGELTLLNLLSDGMLRDNYDYTVLHEFGMDGIDGNKTGRADLILESAHTRDVFYIEAKICASKPNAPTTPEWTDRKLVYDSYNRILDQAKKYITADADSYDPNIGESIDVFQREFYAVALVFDSVVFKTFSEVKGWYNYISQEDNEFYTFKTFPFKEEFVGLACYGMAEKVNI